MAAKSKIQVEIIPNMYNLGLFKKTLSSRIRLRITTLLAVIGLCLVFLVSGLLIRFANLPDWGCAVAIMLCILASIVIAYLVALTIGDVFFSGPWRKKMILGDKFIPDDLEDQKALLKNKSIYFIIFWVLAIVLLCFGCDFCTGSNIRWYQNVGSTLNSMKSDDVSQRRFILKTISNAYYSAKWSDENVREAVRVRLTDSDPEVQQWAAYLAGRAKLVEGTDELTSLAKDDNADTIARREAIIALGRMEWKASRSVLYAVLKKTFAENHADKELIPAVFYAFYMMDEPMAAQETIQMMKTCLDSRDCSSEILQYGFFYLKSHRVKDAASLCFSYIDTPNISEEMRCFASDILRFTASKDDVPRLKAEFKKTSSNAECPIVYRKYHEEPAVILFERDPLRSLYLRSIGNIMDPNDFDWIWMVGSDQNENMQTRKVAEMYTRAMKDKGIVK